MIFPRPLPATYQDVLDAPEHTVAELIGGRLYLQPRPAKPHGRAASVLGMVIGPPYQLSVGGPGGWEIQGEPEIHFGPDVVVPDVAGWRLDVADPNADLTTAYFTTVPQWVCEVLSKSTARKDREEKLPIYAASGVEHAWLVDPIRRTVEIHANASGVFERVQKHKGDAPFRAPPFEAVEIPAQHLWLH